MEYLAVIGDYSRYTDEYGLVQPGPMQSDGTIGTSQNGLLYSAQYSYVLWKKLIFADTDRLVKVYRSCEYSPGVFKRSPTSTEWSSMDDMIGVALFSKLFEPKIAQDVIKHGEAHQWLFGADIRYYFGPLRYPQLVGSLRIAAKLKPTWFQKIYTFLCIAVWPGKEQDDYMLTWMLSRIWEGQSPIIDWAIRRRAEQFKKAYPGGFGQVFVEYSRTKDHPHGRWLLNEY
jgi:hypothetical protein